MGRGWRRAFCTTIPTEERETNQQELALFSSSTTTTTVSNPTTPRLQSNLRCRTFQDPHTQPPSRLGSTPSSPRSPFAILKNTLRLSRVGRHNGCGVCMKGVKTGQGMAIYTAECGHSFHFPCIGSHVRKQGSLICPVCNVVWKDVPLLNFHNSSEAISASAPATPTGTTRVHFKGERTSSVKSRCYNDDEPLVASPRFDPIPEDSEEFLGFFTDNTPKKIVDPYGLSNNKMDRRLNQKLKVEGSKTVNTQTERNVSVKLLPEIAVMSASRTYETYAVALRVKAPMSPTHHRSPMDLVTVLDVSITAPKLQMLKRAMRHIISSLSDADRLSIVAFSSSSQRLLPLTRMTSSGQKSARRIIDKLASGQGTCVAEALKKAAKVLEDRREKNLIATIMLLSDGHGRDGEKVSGLGNQRQKFAHIEIPIHAPTEDSFSKCAGGLLTVAVQDLRVQLGFASGSITAVYTCNSRPSLMNSDSVRLGDLYAEEERELLVELKVPTSALGSHHVLSVRCSYRDPSTQESMYGKERALLVPRPYGVRSNDPRIERLRNAFIYTRALAESRRLVDHGEFSSAHHLIASARALVLQSPVGSGMDYARELEAELAQVHWRKKCHAIAQVQINNGNAVVDNSGEPLTPTSAWRLAKLAMVRKSLNRSVSDLHGFENARF